MTIYVVKRDNKDFYYGDMKDTDIIGYYVNKEKAEVVASTIKKSQTVYRDGYVEAIEVEE